MIPILYEKTERTFATNGIGILTDAASCRVTREDSYLHELQMRYPVGGLHYRELTVRRILLTCPGPGEKPQPYRIWRVTEPIRGICTVYARHISYDLKGIILYPFTANNIYEAANLMTSHQIGSDRFRFTDYADGNGTLTVEVPTDAWTVLMRAAELYGCELRFDHWSVDLVERIGADRGVVLREGKNISELEREATAQDGYTGAYPFWYADGVLVDCRSLDSNGGIIGPGSTVDDSCVLALDLSDRFEAQPMAHELRTAARAYMAEHGLWGTAASNRIVPCLAEHEQVTLGDTVTAIRGAESLSVRVVQTVCDCLAGRYESVALGSITKNVATTIASQQRQLSAAGVSGEWPIGSIRISASNCSPSYLLGGTWELMKKEFSELAETFTLGASGCPFTKTEAISEGILYVIRSAQSLRMRLEFVTAVELDDGAVVLGTMDWSALGMTGTYASIIGAVAFGDNANGVCFVGINTTTGETSVTDILSKSGATSLAAGSKFHCMMELVITSDRMLNDACDKFFWRRVS